jgi:hypothetical protein
VFECGVQGFGGTQEGCENKKMSAKKRVLGGVQYYTCTLVGQVVGGSGGGGGGIKVDGWGSKKGKVQTRWVQTNEPMWLVLKDPSGQSTIGRACDPKCE